MLNNSKLQTDSTPYIPDLKEGVLRRGLIKVKPWIWEESNKLTYTVGWKGKIVYEDTKNKCLDKKVKGNETRMGLREIRNICAKKAKKAQLKAENRVRKWHKFKVLFK